MAKRGQGEGSIARPDGTWWARISLGKDKNGKQKRRAFYGKTRKEVQEKLTAALNDVNNDTYIEPSKMTVAQWMDIWLKEYKSRSVKPTSYYSFCSNAEYHIKPLLGEYQLNQLRGDLIQKFTNTLSDKGLSPKTVKTICNLLKASLQQAVTNGLINKNPANNIIRPRLEQKKMRVLTPEEQEVFIEIARKTEFGEIFILALGTGMRIGELAALTWNDVDFTNNTLRVNKTLTRVKDYYNKSVKKHVEYSTPKTKAGHRTIPLLPNIASMLKGIKEKQSKLRISNKSNLIFCNDDGTPLSDYRIRNSFSDIILQTNIQGLHIHCLRHTFATRGLENGIELKVMQELLGHSSISMTADVYSHVLPDKKKDSIMKLSGTIKLE